MNKSNDKRVIRTKIALKEALCKLLLEKCFDKISIKEIYTLAGYSGVAFYSNFSNKSAIAKEIVDDEINYYVETFLDDIVGEIKNIKKDVVFNKAMGSQIILDYLNHVYNNKLLFNAIFKKNIYPDIVQYFSCELANKLTKYLSFSYNKSPKVDFYDNFLLQIKSSNILILIIYWINSEFFYSPETMTKLFMDLSEMKTTIVHFTPAKSCTESATESRSNNS